MTSAPSSPGEPTQDTPARPFCGYRSFSSQLPLPCMQPSGLQTPVLGPEDVTCDQSFKASLSTESRKQKAARKGASVYKGNDLATLADGDETWLWPEKKMKKKGAQPQNWKPAMGDTHKVALPTVTISEDAQSDTTLGVSLRKDSEHRLNALLKSGELGKRADDKKLASELKHLAPDTIANQQTLGSSPPPEVGKAPLLNIYPSKSKSAFFDPPPSSTSGALEIEQTPLLRATNAILAELIPELALHHIWFLYYNVHLFVHPWFDVAENFERMYGVRVETELLREMWTRVDQRVDVLNMCWSVAIGEKEGQMSYGETCGEEGRIKGENDAVANKAPKASEKVESQKNKGKDVVNSKEREFIRIRSSELRNQLQATLNAKSLTGIRGRGRADVRGTFEETSSPSSLAASTKTPVRHNMTANASGSGTVFGVNDVLNIVGHHGYVAQLVARESINTTEVLLEVLQSEEQRLIAEIRAIDLAAAGSKAPV